MNEFAPLQMQNVDTTLETIPCCSLNRKRDQFHATEKGSVNKLTLNYTVLILTSAG